MVRKVGDRGVVAVVPPQCPGTGQQAGFSQAAQPVTGNMVGLLTFDSPITIAFLLACCFLATTSGRRAS